MTNKTIEQRIIALLKEEQQLNLNSLSKLLHIGSGSDEYEILKAVLEGMVQDNILSKSSRRRYSLAGSGSNPEEGRNIFTGTFRVQRNSGIIEDNDYDKTSRVQVADNDSRTALDGDRVEFSISSRKKSRKANAKVLRVIERAEHNIEGRLDFDGTDYYLVPAEKRYHVDFLIPKNKTGEAKPGKMVSASFTKWDEAGKSPQAKVNKVLNPDKTAADLFEKIVRSYELPLRFPKAVTEEAETYKAPRDQKSYKDRLDLREKLIVTIDPHDAKDFDDALSLEKAENGNLLLGVHIADVSHYVVENSELDIEARNRGNSTYLVDRVVPMLPENLSNDICSLKPMVIRNAFSVIMELDAGLKVKDYRIAETVIKSKRRYAYEEVLDIINGAEDQYSGLLLALNELAVKLRKKRFQTGGIDFETSEARFRLDEDKNPVSVIMKAATLSTQLVEECMLLANKTVAEHVVKISRKLGYRETLPFMYRTHDEPEPGLISEALQFLGIKVKASKKSDGITSKDINGILKQFKDHPEEKVVNQILIRSMPKALYSTDNTHHFGLGFLDYSHFTSPIRRYSDLVVHRLLKEYAKGLPDANRIAYVKALLKSVCKHINLTEKSSMEAERASTKTAFTIMMQKHVGEQFDGIISGVTSFGIFVSLENVFAEGLVHIKDIQDDYYKYEEGKHRLVGRRYKKEYRIGGKVRITVKRVNPEKGQIDLLLAE